MRAPFWFLLLAACAAQPVVPPITPPAAPEHREVEQQPQGVHAGFQSRELGLLEELPEPYGLTGVHLRKSAPYRELTRGLAVRIEPGLTCSGYVETLGELVLRIEASGHAKGEEGHEVLRILQVLVGEERTKLASYGDQPLARARADGVDLVPGGQMDAGDDLQLRGENWIVQGYPGGGRLRIPITARSNFLERHPEQWRLFLTRELAYDTVTFFDFMARLQAATVDVSSAVVALSQNAVAWENYLQRGYPQYPWENLANSWLVSSAWDRAPSGQFVLLHPEPGALMDVDRADTADLSAGLLVHGLGYLRYFGDDRAWFCGASATGCLTGDEGNGFGYGLTLHVGSTKASNPLPHISVGLLYHDGVEDDGFQVSLGVDVLRLLGR